MDTIICNNCGKPVEVDKALRHQMEEKIRKEEKEKALKDIEQAKIDAVNIAKKQFEEESENKNKKVLKEAEEEKTKREALEEKLESFEKEKLKDEAKIKENASKEADDRHRLEKLEWEKQKAGMQKSIDEAKRKGNQGSQQLQGDVLELDLEERLRQAFPYDEFKPVPTGIKGGDIIQEIKNKFGNSAGSILWEAKRQKAWSKPWLIKLKEDMREVGASDCILVTDILPPSIKVYDRVDNVWVTSYEYIIKLASVIRYGLLNVAIVRSTASHSDEQLKELYRVITSDSFRQMFEARDEIISAMRIELEADKRSAEKRWKRQGAYVDKLDRNNSRIYGELQSYIPSLKPLKEAELLQIDAGDEEDN